MVEALIAISSITLIPESKDRRRILFERDSLDNVVLSYLRIRKDRRVMTKRSLLDQD